MELVKSREDVVQIIKNHDYKELTVIMLIYQFSLTNVESDVAVLVAESY